MKYLPLILLVFSAFSLALGQEIGKGDARALLKFKELKNTSDKQAETFLVETLKKNDSPFLRYELGLLYASGDRQNDAISQFKKVIESQPEFPGVSRNLAILLVKVKRYQDAITVLTTLAKRQDLGAELNLVLGEAYSVEGNHLAALQCFNASLPAYPKEVDLRLKIAETLYNLKRYNESESAADAVLKNNASLASAWVIRGNCNLKLGNMQGTVDCFEAARLLDPEMGRRLLPVLGSVYLSLDMPKMAAECYRQSGDTAISQQISLARAFYADNDIENANAVLEGISAKSRALPREAELLVALLKLRSGDIKSAEALLSKYIKTYPLDGEALVALAEIAAKGDREDAAVAWYRAARQSKTWKRYAMESELDLYLRSRNNDAALSLIGELKLSFPSPHWDELEKQLR